MHIPTTSANKWDGGNRALHVGCAHGIRQKYHARKYPIVQVARGAFFLRHPFAYMRFNRDSLFVRDVHIA